MLNNFLLVDDDQDDCDLFQEALRNIDSSIQINTSNNFSEIIDRLRTGDMQPQIIFLDINMPEMNGWECLSKLKSDSILKGIPVVMYSTSPASIDGKKAVSRGAICFLEKPPSYLKLRQFLRQLTKSNIENLGVELQSIAASQDYRMVVG